MGSKSSKANAANSVAEGDLVDIKTRHSGWTVGEVTSVQRNKVIVTTNERSEDEWGNRTLGRSYTLDLKTDLSLLAPMGTHSAVGQHSSGASQQAHESHRQSPRQHHVSSGPASQGPPASLSVGSRVDVLDYFEGERSGRPMQQWFKGTVKQMEADGSKICIKFDGFPSPECDKWLDASDFPSRLAACGSRSTGSTPQYRDLESQPFSPTALGGTPTLPTTPVHAMGGEGGTLVDMGGGAPPGASPVPPSSPATLVPSNPDTYSVGAWVDVQLPPPSGKWVLARITSVTRDGDFTALEVSYTSGPSYATNRPTATETIVVDPTASNVEVAGAKSSAPLHAWGVGQYVDVLDMFKAPYAHGGWDQQWRWGEVLRTHPDAVMVRFVDAPHRPDMWFDCSNPDIAARLQPHGSVTTSAESTVQKERREKDEVFRAALASAGFEVVPISNDNKCLFRAIAHQIYGDAELYGTVKAKLLQHMRKHADTFSIIAAGVDGVGSLEEYCTRMQADTSWGGYPEQIAAEEVFDRPVVVYSSDEFHARGQVLEPSTLHFDGELPDAELQAASVAPILLTYHGGDHYNSLVVSAAPKERKPPLGGLDTRIILAARQAREQAGEVALAGIPASSLDASVDLLGLGEASGTTSVAPPSPELAGGVLSPPRIPPPSSPGLSLGPAASGSPGDLVRQRSRPSFDEATGTFSFRASLPRVVSAGAGTTGTPLSATVHSRLHSAPVAAGAGASVPPPTSPTVSAGAGRGVLSPGDPKPSAPPLPSGDAGGDTTQHTADVKAVGGDDDSGGEDDLLGLGRS